ncbi:response regulator transcription factor [Corynebacterium sp. 153RC1]|uniref:response regulator transcription factor n=1 Tax=unclassified Corynebacterium TaxID=2624378 RepID=UPI00211CCD53|nr:MULTISPECIES: response regulator transcription factor [unclassified Corynebacterium]MCQ9352546.1 response regulator transcription factor [Corynebacterium sp. 209RC1]MCQ9354730.1 response regulator transcription factor [Corynebacterium sp. 1222RC1]MCQ9356841.1 response regulator transcription factor [Corynebacterium sp. 122RC1]MCQ9358955.1 response regulator transcription factor [Corynebacterium sp. 142RC1]MCQ9361309.1 response regulator transcription factor [Corynebacterium sp. 153RC1]
MIDIVIADDEALVGSSLATLLSLEEDFRVRGVCSSGEELLAVWAPGFVAVLDYHMSGMDGLATAQELLKSDPAARILMVTSHARPQRLKRALELGILGYLPKTASAQDFADAVRTVHGGRRFIDADLAAHTIGLPDSPLTPREVEVLELAGAGLSVQQIARKVYLAPGTTRNYLSSAIGKVGAANKVEAYLRAREAGWI